MRAFLLVPLIAIAVPDRPNPSPQDTRPTQERLLGQWLMIKRVTNGKDDPNLANLTLVFSNDKMEHVTLGQTNAMATFPYTLDVGKNPAVIEFTQSGRIAGLLRIEGETLTICLEMTGQGKLPASFDSPIGSSHSLLQLKRVRK
jgi:uncharacterized protein (TIGR03067 family)